MLKTQFFAGAALIAGVAIGYFAKPEAAAPGGGAAVSASAGSKVEDKGDAASLAALRAKVARLERRLAEVLSAQTNMPERAVEQLAAPGGQPGGRRHIPPSFKEMRERIERMKKEDPARFAQMTNHFAQMRRWQVSRARSKLDFLASVDTSGMSEAAVAAHEDFQDMIARREELIEKLHDENIPDAEREGVMKDLQETGRALARLGMAERDMLLERTAAALGLSGDDSAEFSSTVKAIFESTEGGMMRGGPRPPPPR